MRTRLLLCSTTALLLGTLPALAQSAAQGEAKPKASEAPADGPRRDPQGVKGISPFWESIKKGDDAYIIRDFDQAISAYKQALTHEPQNPLGHYRLGEAQLAKGSMDEARASWEAAKRFSGSNEAIKSKVLFVLADLSERERALDDADNAWSAYESHAQANPSIKTYPETPPERKKRIAEWKKLEQEYAAVKERIKQRLAEAEKQ